MRISNIISKNDLQSELSRSNLYQVSKCIKHIQKPPQDVFRSRSLIPPNVLRPLRADGPITHDMKTSATEHLPGAGASWATVQTWVFPNLRTDGDPGLRCFEIFFLHFPSLSMDLDTPKFFAQNLFWDWNSVSPTGRGARGRQFPALCARKDDVRLSSGFRPWIIQAELRWTSMNFDELCQGLRFSKVSRELPEMGPPVIIPIFVGKSLVNPPASDKGVPPWRAGNPHMIF